MYKNGLPRRKKRHKKRYEKSKRSLMYKKLRDRRRETNRTNIKERTDD